MHKVRFTFTNTKKKLFSTEYRVVLSLIGPSLTGKSQLIINWLKTTTFQPRSKFWQILRLSINIPSHFNILCKKKEDCKSRICSKFKFEIIHSLGNNGKKYSFDNLGDKIFNWKAFIDSASTRRYRRFNTIYIKEKFFNPSKLGRDLELKSTPTVFFRTHPWCDASQFTLNTIRIRVKPSWP